jgi:antitoxin VapB
MTTAKIFMNGGSQAVRLPKEFRFDEDEVCIKRVGSAVLIFPKSKAWELFDEAIGKVDEDFMADREQPPAAEEREPL